MGTGPERMFIGRRKTANEAERTAVALNEQLASIRLSYAIHRLPGVRAVGRRIHPLSYFRWVKLSAGIASRVYPADLRRIRYMRKMLEESFSEGEILAMARENLVYRKWMRALIHAWPNCAGRCQEWALVEGAEHLVEALREQRGAILLSGHAFGFPTLVAPVLSENGFRIHRTGRGLRGDPEKRWGREWEFEGWAYSTFGRDFWQHVRALNRMRVAVGKNEVLHLLIRGLPKGEADLEISFHNRNFFLDTVAFRIIESLQAPVLPCFAHFDKEGRLNIRIFAALAPARSEIMSVFGPLYSKTIEETPQLAYFWRGMARREESW